MLAAMYSEKCPVVSILSGLIALIKRKSGKKNRFLISTINFAKLFERFYT
jgi:hypothetical protein